MKRAVVISLAGHAIALASVALAVTREGLPPPLPTKAYAVNLVAMPGEQKNRKSKGEAKPSQLVPKTEVVKTRQRSGQKVDQAPSTEAMSPKGTKQPARKAKQKPAPETKKGGQQQGGGPALRLEGEPFPYPEYLNDMVTLITEAWDQPFVGNRAEVLKTTIFFTILRDGTIGECEVEVRSEVPLFDRSALEAVLSVDPLPALPEGFKGNQLGVHLDFLEN